MRVKNPLGASVGDEVVIHVPDSLVLRAAFRLYGFPMVAFFIVGAFGWFAADWTGSAAGELWAALGGFLGVFASYALIYRSERRKPVGAAHAWITRVKAKALHIPVHS